MCEINGLALNERCHISNNIIFKLNSIVSEWRFKYEHDRYLINRSIALRKNEKQLTNQQNHIEFPFQMIECVTGFLLSHSLIWQTLVMTWVDMVCVRIYSEVRSDLQWIAQWFGIGLMPVRWNVRMMIGWAKKIEHWLIGSLLEDLEIAILREVDPDIELRTTHIITSSFRGTITFKVLNTIFKCCEVEEGGAWVCVYVRIRQFIRTLWWITCSFYFCLFFFFFSFNPVQCKGT